MIAKNITLKDLTIRPFKESDCELWIKWDSDETVQEFMPEPFFVMSLQERKFIWKTV